MFCLKFYFLIYITSDNIEEKRNVPIHKLMEELGGLPMLGSASGGGWNASLFSLEDLFFQSFKMVSKGDRPLIDMHIKWVYSLGKIQYILVVRPINNGF